MILYIMKMKIGLVVDVFADDDRSDDSVLVLLEKSQSKRLEEYYHSS